jgi:hypothetical protein
MSRLDGGRVRSITRWRALLTLCSELAVRNGQYSSQSENMVLSVLILIDKGLDHALHPINGT